LKPTVRMGTRWLGVVALVTAGCVQPAIIDLELAAPSDLQGDVSCVTAIELRAIGTSYPRDHSDFTRQCVPLVQSPASYEAIHEAIRGRFDIAVPESGLAGVSLLGLAGTDACTPSELFYSTPNLVFSASAAYAGDATLTLAAEPNLDCKQSSATFRVVDMMALAASQSSAGCPAAMTLGDGDFTGLGTLVPDWFDDGLVFFGNDRSWPAANDMTQGTGMVTLLQSAPRSCLAAIGVSNNGLPEIGSGIGCIIGGPSVCAGSGELEIASIRDTVRQHADLALASRFPTITYGSVWSGAAPRLPIAGAEVTIDPRRGTVVYIDPPAADGSFSARRDQRGTGPSGLFVVYADTIVRATIRALGTTRTVTLGGSNETAGGALVVMP